MTIRTIAISAVSALTFSLGALGQAHAANTASQAEPFIQGFPEAIPSRCESVEHSSKKIWVGRFDGRSSSDELFGRQRASRIVCFTSHQTCKRWLGVMNRDFSGFQYEAACLRGAKHI
ncbi:hypothetical protein [Coralliovum pocilloporae]|uniref:hypothetical protein n=1 Tax=Coralliovum pocilloporae TaxID=3066369 RepID=UPI003306D7BE